MTLVGLVTFCLCWCLARPPTARLRAVAGARAATPAGPRQDLVGVVEDPLRRTVVCVVACVAAVGLWGGAAYGVLGVPAGIVVSRWIAGLESPSQVRRREATERDLPVVADLLAACAAAGRPTNESLSLVSTAVGGPLAALLDDIVARIALGADPVSEWRSLAAHAQLGPLSRAICRSLESGAPLVEAMSRLADDSRRDRRTATQARARKVGVHAAAPLAACFLPAFMLIGVVPTIGGAFSHLVLG